MMNTWQTQEKLKRRFTLPNEIFQMDLSAEAKLVYAYSCTSRIAEPTSAIPATSESD